MDNNFQNNEQYYQVSNEFTTENFENSNSESLLPQSEIKYTRDRKRRGLHNSSPFKIRFL